MTRRAAAGKDVPDMVSQKSRAHRLWKSEQEPNPEKVAHVEPLTGADMVRTNDPAFAHIVAAGRKLIQFGFNPNDPDMAARAVEVGRADYEKDCVVRAKQSQESSVRRRFGEPGLAEDEVVYYMRIGNRVKIGWSTSLATRLAAINPEELMATEPGSRHLERMRHSQFGDLRTHGEWFQLQPPLTEHIAQVKATADTQAESGS